MRTDRRGANRQHLAKLVPLSSRPVSPVPFGVIELWRERRVKSGPRLVFYEMATALHQRSLTRPTIWYRSVDTKFQPYFEQLSVGLKPKVTVVDLAPGFWEIAVSDPDDGYWPPTRPDRWPFLPSQVERFTVERGEVGVYEVCAKVARWTLFRPRPKLLVDYYYHGWCRSDRSGSS